MQIMAPKAFSAHIKVYSYTPDGVQTWSWRSGETQTYDLIPIRGLIYASEV
jgi:hypothetical protein